MSTSQFLIYQITKNLEQQKKQKAARKKKPIADLNTSTSPISIKTEKKPSFVPRVAKLKDYSNLTESIELE